MSPKPTSSALGACGLALLLGLPGLSCAPGEPHVDEPEAPSTDTLALEPVLGEDPPAPAEPADEPPARPDSPSLPATGPLAEPSPPAAEPPAERPALPSREVRPATGVVRGRIEIRIDARTSMPADYLYVRLRIGRTAMDTWTNREGEFFFERVPAGVHDLEVLNSPRAGRAVHQSRVTVEPGGSLRLPVVTIPVDSIRG